MRITLTLFLAALLAPCIANAESSGSRDDAFIGYSERALECQDRLENCREKAKHGGCLTDPYNMRTFCPVTCVVSKCLSTGTYKVRHHGHATLEDTSAFVERWVSRVQQGKGAPAGLERHFRTYTFPDGAELHLSSLGVGTYLGAEDERTDDAVTSAVIYSVAGGWNVIDTASNYRSGRAEKAVGAALGSLLAGAAAKAFLHEREYDTDVTRSMLFVSSKVGFTDPELAQQLIKANLITRRDVAGGHTLAPAYVRASVNTSLDRLGLQTLDLVYLHNAAEMQLRGLGWEAFRRKLKEAFSELESLRASGSLRYYGLATWDCFRVPPSDPGHVSLEEVVALAKDVAGPGKVSGFAAIQLPISASMREAWTQPWQRVGNASMTLMQAAEKLRVAVFTSGPLGEGDLPRRLTSRLDSVVELRAQSTTPQKLLQLARSTPGASMVTTLVGHKTREYVVANTQLATQQPLTEIQFRSAMAQVQAIMDGPTTGVTAAAESL